MGGFEFYGTLIFGFYLGALVASLVIALLHKKPLP